MEQFRPLNNTSPFDDSFQLRAQVAILNTRPADDKDAAHTPHRGPNRASAVPQRKAETRWWSRVTARWGRGVNTCVQWRRPCFEVFGDAQLDWLAKLQYSVKAYGHILRCLRSDP